jgi:hypothetical protein
MQLGSIVRIPWVAQVLVIRTRNAAGVERMSCDLLEVLQRLGASRSQSKTSGPLRQTIDSRGRGEDRLRKTVLVY